MASVVGCGGNRWLQFLNNRGRGRSLDQVIFFFFFKFSLVYYLSKDCPWIQWFLENVRLSRLLNNALHCESIYLTGATTAQ